MAVFKAGTPEVKYYSPEVSQTSQLKARIVTFSKSSERASVTPRVGSEAKPASSRSAANGLVLPRFPRSALASRIRGVDRRAAKE